MAAIVFERGWQYSSQSPDLGGADGDQVARHRPISNGGGMVETRLGPRRAKRGWSEDFDACRLCRVRRPVEVELPHLGSLSLNGNPGLSNEGFEAGRDRDGE